MYSLRLVLPRPLTCYLYRPRPSRMAGLFFPPFCLCCCWTVLFLPDPPLHPSSERKLTLWRRSVLRRVPTRDIPAPSPVIFSSSSVFDRFFCVSPPREALTTRSPPPSNASSGTASPPAGRSVSVRPQVPQSFQALLCSYRPQGVFF